MNKTLAIGLMSGTSVDGIDAALVAIKEQQKLEVDLLGYTTIAYEQDYRQEILQACDEKQGTVDRICRLNFSLGEKLARAVEEVCRLAHVPLEDIDVVGSHGQTIYHDVEDDQSVSTLQIGSASVLAERTGITTVSNFRARDIAAGGQGAPLVPYVDYLLFTSPSHHRVLQNIGGIGNYTFLPQNACLSDVTGTDTGPGNMLLDGLVHTITRGEHTYDEGGQWAAQGDIHEPLLQWLMAHPFIEKPAPKTTGRELFGQALVDTILKKGQEHGLSPADMLATTTAFTALSMVKAYKDYLPQSPREVIISGGGSHNAFLLSLLEKYCHRDLHAEIQIRQLEELGMPGDAKEAIAFAILAYATLQGQNNNVPRVTGATKPVILGDITPGRNFFSHLRW